MGGTGRCELKQARTVDVLKEGTVVVPASGAKTRLHGCLSKPVSVKDASGDLC